MKAVILAGGLGTRLREETTFRPKPMVEIGGRPILWHLMKIFDHYGIRDFVICTGYKGDVIKDYFVNYYSHNSDFTVSLGRHDGIVFHDPHLESDWHVTVADTGMETQTGGRLKRIARYLENEPFIATYGDGLTNVDIDELINFHKSHGQLATLTMFRPVSRFGVLELSEDSKPMVKNFKEKPVTDGWVSAGFFVFQPEVLDLIEGDATVLEQATLKTLAAKDELMAFAHEGFFQPMDTYREVQLLNEMWNSQAPWKVW